MIGVFGGTFDPIHFGHLRMAEELAEAIGLDKVRFIPSGQPPHRAAPATPAEQRLHMVQLAVADNPLFRVDGREIETGGPRFSVDTLDSLRRELGEDIPIWLFVGMDAFLGFTTWKDWRRLFDLAHIAVAHRPGYSLNEAGLVPEMLREELDKRLQTVATKTASGTIVLNPVTQLDISSTRLRSMLATGNSARYLIPDNVRDYIQTNKLYLNT